MELPEATKEEERTWPERGVTTCQPTQINSMAQPKNNSHLASQRGFLVVLGLAQCLSDHTMGGLLAHDLDSILAACFIRSSHLQTMGDQWP